MGLGILKSFDDILSPIKLYQFVVDVGNELALTRQQLYSVAQELSQVEVAPKA